MALSLLSDENLNGDIVRGLLLQRPGWTWFGFRIWRSLGRRIRRCWNGQRGRGVVWCHHDRRTIPGFAYDRVSRGMPMAGLFLLSHRMPMSEAIEELLLLDECSEQGEWDALIVYLPL